MEESSNLSPEQLQVAGAIFEVILQYNTEEITPSLAGKLAFELAGIEADYSPSILPPRIVGIAEIAELVGRSKQNVFGHSKLSSFPKPIAKLAMGSIWDGAEVVEYYELRRQPFRPVE